MTDVVVMLTPPLLIIMGFLYGNSLAAKDSNPVHRFSQEERTLLILRSQFLEDKLTIDQFEIAVERALNGAGFMQAVEGMSLPYTRRPLMAEPTK